MTIETPEPGRELHRPDQDATGWTVFAFDRDDTIDLNPPPWEDREAVPLEWVAYLAHRTGHIVSATGNQLLKQEASIPGTQEIIDAHPNVDLAQEGTTESLYFSRQQRIQLLSELYPNAEQHIVVDDVDLSALDSWTHYFSWDFVPAAREGNIVPEFRLAKYLSLDLRML